ncbi:MAG: DUF480 domain-containing protein [Thiogranum sp.]|nr:DUF480 domain-containing protein [Thiogranum sp.]
MNIHLSLNESRVIGCLIEKAVTTPEQYPLSLNALTNACNQKSNRDPVLELDEATVQQTVDELVKRRLVIDKTGFGSRVPKYQQRFCNTEFGSLKFTDQELGIICVLLLRGAQTPGELRTRTSRLCSFSDVQQVEATIAQLMQRDDGPFVARLPREPGKRESRYMHLFSGDAPEEAAAQTPATATDAARIEALEQRLEQLQQQVERLEERLGALPHQA